MTKHCEDVDYQIIHALGGATETVSPQSDGASTQKTFSDYMADGHSDARDNLCIRISEMKMLSGSPMRQLIHITKDLEIIGDVSDMAYVGKWQSGDLRRYVEMGVAIPKDSPILIFDDSAKNGSPTRSIQFFSDRTFIGVREEDKEKASVFWNAIMDELEKMQGEGK